MSPVSPAKAAENRRRNRRRPELHPADPTQEESTRNEKGQFIKGGSGNPQGKPYGAISFVVALRRRLTEHPEQAEKILRELIRMASNPGPNQLPAIKEILDRVDGKPTEHHVVEGETPMRLIFVPAEPLPLPPNPFPILPYPQPSGTGDSPYVIPNNTVQYNPDGLQVTLP